MVDARLPGGHRVNVVIPPIALDGPTITIRKFANATMTLGDVCSVQAQQAAGFATLAWAVQTRKNIMIAWQCRGRAKLRCSMLSCEIP